MNQFALIAGAGADLPATVTDALGIASLLADAGRCAFPAANVALLAEEGATRARILAELDRLAEKTSQSDEATVVVYFSGHGCTVHTPTGDSFFLLPFGYDVQQLAQTAISGRQLAGKLATIRAQRLLLLLDCCHAGRITGERANAPGLMLVKTPLPPEVRPLFATGSGRVLIASSRAGEVSHAGKPYGLFTRALIECLAGAGVARRDGYVRALDLALYVREVVPRWSNGRQHPIADVEPTDNFVVACYAAGAAEPKALGLSPIDPAEVERLNARAIQQQFGDIDLRGSQGAIVGAPGPIHQTFGPLTNNWGPEISSGGGDVIVADVGEGAQNVAIGQDITQAVTTTSTAGSSLPEFAALLATLRGALAAATLPPDEQSIVEGDLAIVAAQLARPDPNLTVIKTKLSGVKELLYNRDHR